MYCLDSISLKGNPIVQKFPELAGIHNDENAVARALSNYFGGSTGASLPTMKTQMSQPKQQIPNVSVGQFGTSGLASMSSTNSD